MRDMAAERVRALPGGFEEFQTITKRIGGVDASEAGELSIQNQALVR
jgi:hypothetical protein